MTLWASSITTITTKPWWIVWVWLSPGTPTPAPSSRERRGWMAGGMAWMMIARSRGHVHWVWITTELSGLLRILKHCHVLPCIQWILIKWAFIINYYYFYYFNIGFLWSFSAIPCYQWSYALCTWTSCCCHNVVRDSVQLSLVAIRCGSLWCHSRYPYNV